MKKIPLLHLFLYALATSSTGMGSGFIEGDDDLIAAIDSDNVSHEQLERALEDITDINSPAHAFLVRAAENNNLTAVQFLLQQGADPNLPDRHGRTALMQAAYSNHPEVVRALLKCERTNPNIEEGGTGGHRTALMTAAVFGRQEVVEVFMGFPHINVRYKDAHSGMTALMWAVTTSSPHQGIVESLCEADSTLAAQDNNGRTAYSIAHKRGHKALLNLLHFEGCEPPEAIEVEQSSQPDTDEQSVTLLGAFNLNKTEGDVEAKNEDIMTNINMSSDTKAIPSLTGGFNFHKTKGKITLSGGTKETNINIGESPTLSIVVAPTQEEDENDEEDE